MVTRSVVFGVVVGLLLGTCKSSAPEPASAAASPPLLLKPVPPPPASARAEQQPPPRPAIDPAWANLKPDVAGLFDVKEDALEPHLGRLGELDIRDAKTLKAVLESSSTKPLPRLMVLSRFEDHVGALPLAQAALKDNPKNAWAAYLLASAQRALGDGAGAISTVRAISVHKDSLDTDWSRYFFRYYVLPLRCELLWDEGKKAEVDEACHTSFRYSSLTSTHRAAARWLTSEKQYDEALGILEKALLDRESGDTHFVRGIVRTELKDAAGAKAAFELATTRWPMLSPAWRCLDGAPCDLAHADAELKAWNRRRDSIGMIHVSRIYRALEMPAEVEKRLDAAERLDPGIGMAERLAQKSLTDEAGSVTGAKALLAKTKAGAEHPHLLALVAVGTMEQDPEAARALLDRGRALDPGNPWVNQALALWCARKGDEACFRDALRRVDSGDPRVEWPKNATAQVRSELLPFPPPKVTEIVIAPYIEGAMPELDGLGDVLHRRFPMIRFRQLETRPIPHEWLARGNTQVDFSVVLSATLPEAQMIVVAVDRDGFAGGGGNFVYSTFAGRKGAASVSRFRTAEGDPAGPGPLPIGDARSKERFQAQMTSTVAKLLGVSFPCEAAKCVLKFPNNMTQFDAKGGEFCPAHKAELAKLMK